MQPLVHATTRAGAVHCRSRRERVQESHLAGGERSPNIRYFFFSDPGGAGGDLPE